MRMSEREFQAMLQKNQCVAAKLGLQNGFTGGNKYRNIKVYIYEDGYIAFGGKEPAHGRIHMIFDSKKEYDRWNELLLLQRAGKIHDVKRQVKIVIQEQENIQGTIVREIAYKADFLYVEKDSIIVEDVKPFDVATQRYKTTKDFRLKWKLLMTKYKDWVFRIY